MATTESVNVIRLPYRGISDWSEDSLVALNRNFSEIEFYLGQIQKYMNESGFTAYKDLSEFMEHAITYGLDAQKPRITNSMKKYYKIYIAEDTKKAYYARLR